MSAVYFLIPGARVPHAVLPTVMSKLERTAFDALTRGAGTVQTQTLVTNPVLEGATHLVWLWQVIAKVGGMPQTAAFEWEADGGPSMSAETWRFTAYHLEGNVSHSVEASLTESERDALHDAMHALVQPFGFFLQQWVGRWYLTRKDDWGIAVKPWCAQNHQPITPDSFHGENANEFEALQKAVGDYLAEHPVNVARRAAGLPTIDGFWPDGGSRRYLLKASTLRAVMANDSFVAGWAQNAGLLNFRTTRVLEDWPEAPEGDLLCVIDDLYEPYRQGDWDGWIATWPRVWETIARLTESAKARRAQKLVLVATGSTDTRTCVTEFKKTTGFFARFNKSAPLNLEDFLGE